MRQSGILLHLTPPSPAREGIGTLGAEARQFVFSGGLRHRHLAGAASSPTA